MNSNFFSRVAGVCLGIVAALAVTTSSASAWETKPWTGKEHLKVVALPGSSIKVVDDETFGSDEVATYNLSGTVFGKLSSASWDFTHSLSRCAGNEVRAELWTEGFTGVYQVAHGTAYLKLYEGTSCQTPNLNGVSQKVSFTLYEGESTTKTIFVENMTEGGDYAIATIKFGAVLGSGS